MKFSICFILISIIVGVNCDSTPCTSEFINLPCGTFISYDYDKPEIVLKHGFNAGEAYDGAKAYVGHANNAHCSNEFNCPARLKVTGSYLGAYLSCINEHYETSSVRFLVNHPNLKWITTSQNLETIPNAIKIRSSSTFTWYIGRKNFSRSDGSVYSVVSKATATSIMLYSIGPGYHTVENVEILTC